MPDNYEVKWMIAFCFCNTATTIVSGALAERTFNHTYYFSTVLLAGLVYPLGAGWVWGGGWLEEMGFIDHAGSGVVHLVGGATGLIGAILLGPRLGYFKNSSLDKFKVGRAEIQTYMQKLAQVREDLEILLDRRKHMMRQGADFSEPEENKAQSVRVSTQSALDMIEPESPQVPDLKNPFKPLEQRPRKGSTAFLDEEVLRFLSSNLAR